MTLGDVSSSSSSIHLPSPLFTSLSHERAKSPRKRDITAVTATLSRSVCPDFGVPSLDVRYVPYTNVRIYVRTLFRHRYCFATIARFVVSHRSTPTTFPLDGARSFFSFLPLTSRTSFYEFASVSPRRSVDSPLFFFSLVLSFIFSVFLSARCIRIFPRYTE